MDKMIKLDRYGEPRIFIDSSEIEFLIKFFMSAHSCDDYKHIKSLVKSAYNINN